jgi:protein O-GlcNAc transferase
VAVVGVALAAGDGSPVAARVRSACDEFAEAGALDPQRLDALLRDLDLDLLVDLGGLTSGARPRALAARPAALQVGYLGYPATTGAPWMDYLLADRFVVPPEARCFYDEHVVWLPDTYLAGEVSDTPGGGATRAQAGLPADAFVFCNFNQWYRLNPASFDVFLRLLARIPAAVLWLRDHGAAAAGRLRERAEAAGVAGERLVFALYAPDRAAHLARLRLADLFLDSLPYNAHTTARDALGMGVPVLTCAGASFASRVAGSLLTSLGLPELITTSRDAFEAQAFLLAHRPAELDVLRERIAAARAHSAAFEPRRQAAQLEAAYAAMHALVRAGEPPRPLAVELP